jgi:hypothetical protein
LYKRWNFAIADHFFKPELAGEPVRLAFDDSVALTVAHGIDESLDDLLRAITEMIIEGADPFRRFLIPDPERADVFPAIALLATHVLAASRMGEGDADPHRFWPIFEDMVGAELSNDDREDISNIWFACQTFYDATLSGSRGRLTLPPDPRKMPLLDRRHINLPLWQCSLREVDRDQLRRRFTVASPAELKADPKQIVKVVSKWPDLNRTLQNTLRWAGENPDFALQLGLSLQEIRDEVQSGATGSHIVRKSRAASRIRLIGRRELHCYLQKRDSAGRWFDAADLKGNIRPLTPEEIAFGVDADTFDVPWAGGDHIAFMDAGDEGYVLLRGSIAGAVRVLLLFTTANAPDDEVAPSDRWQHRRLEPDLARDFTCIAGTLDPDNDATLAQLFEVSLSPQRIFVFDGGLRPTRGCTNEYLMGAPPRVRIEDRNAKVALDGDPLASTGHEIVALPASLSVGRHVVRVGSYEEAFDVVNVPDDEDGEPGVLGYSLDRKGILRVVPADSACANVLVGADLRTA